MNDPMIPTFCGACGTRFRDDAEFCHGCGARRAEFSSPFRQSADPSAVNTNSAQFAGGAGVTDTSNDTSNDTAGWRPGEEAAQDSLQPVAVTPTEGGSSPHRFRAPDASTVGSLVPLAGLFLLSLAVISPVASIIGAILHVPAWIFIILYLAAGGLVFVRSVQELIAGWFFKARRPLDWERERIDRVWGVVAQAAGVDANHYLLRVEESDDLNASASGGHLITLTTAALAQLPDDELSAVVAHELGHHLGMHTLISGFANWLLLPINALLTVGNVGARILNGISRVFGAVGNGPAALVTGLFSLLAQLYLFIFSLFVRLAMSCLGMVGRQSEYAADATAAQLGFGPGLLSALHLFQYEEGEPASKKRTLREMMSETHPRTSDRIARLERMRD